MEEKIKSKSTRDGFGEGLVELGKKNKDVVVLSADLTDSTRAGWFKRDFPERFFSLGIAEQDMFCTAVGMSMMGKIPYACTFGVFAAERALNQLSISVCYMKLNVKIVGTHGGISVGPDGATHQALNEIALMRVLPNMTVIVPCDALEAKRATILAAQCPGPVYLRFSRNNVPQVTKEEDKFEIGKANVLKKGGDLTFIACGTMTGVALEAAADLEKKGISAQVINMHTIKPIDREAIIGAAKKTGAIVTCEEHSVIGGLGSAVCEVLSQTCPVPVKIVGVEDRFGESGEAEELFEYFGLTRENLVKTAKELLAAKKNR
ncbi:MAG: transketolase family protein [Candidatus Omnitrophota bacterium]